MKKVFISKNYKDRFTASSKAKLDVEKILVKNGYKNIGLHSKSIQNKYIGRLYTILSNIIAVFRMPKNGIVFLQYPVNLVNRQVKIAKGRNNRVYVLIHDLNILRQLNNDSLLPLKEGDVLIAHTPAMREWLQENKINENIEILNIFDYLESDKSKIPYDKKYKIAFAGNLEKSTFLEQLKGDENHSYRLFGIRGEKLKLNPGVEFCGCYPPDKLAQNLNSHFGLVWDGFSIKECLGVNGDYLKYISPHKLSMYLSAGIPVIVWDKSAMASFVTDNNVGLVVSSLEEIPMLLGNLKKDRYESMVKSANNIAIKLGEGEFLTSILNGIS